MSDHPCGAELYRDSGECCRRTGCTALHHDQGALSDVGCRANPVGGETATGRDVDERAAGGAEDGARENVGGVVGRVSEGVGVVGGGGDGEEGEAGHLEAGLSEVVLPDVKMGGGEDGADVGDGGVEAGLVDVAVALVGVGDGLKGVGVEHELVEGDVVAEGGDGGGGGGGEEGGGGGGGEEDTGGGREGGVGGGGGG